MSLNMVGSSILEATSHTPYGLATALILTLVYFVQWYLSRPKKLGLPVAGHRDDSDITETLLKMKATHPNEPFILPMNPTRVVLPHTMLNEIAYLPDNKLSFRTAAYNLMEGRYTGLADDRPQLVEAIKVDLTRNISKTLSALQDEVIHAMGEEVGECPDWTPIKPFEALLRIVAMISGRVFVGLPLCRDETWIRITINYTEDAVKGVRAIRKYPEFLRPIVAPFIPALREVKQYRKRAGKMLAPTVEEIKIAKKRWKAMGKGDAPAEDDKSSPILDEQFNLISWVLSHYKDNDEIDVEWVGQGQLMAAFAAIHTTSMTATNVIYDLASHPEFLAPLRAELMEVSREEPDGQLRKNNIPKLRKLDSFIKESQRVHPLGILSVMRSVTAKEGITLSNGLHLPYETEMAMGHTQQTSVIPREFMTKTPPQPSFDEFHPFRYSDLRSHPGEENKHQFVTTSPESLSFGHGRWACPGRFFASNEIKVILCYLIKNYDIGLGPKGEGEGGEFKRPTTYTVDGSYVPDPSAHIYFRKLQAP